ncbi:MAG: squalene--hopene cyclase [Wenzhouxiangella sp.]
MTVQPLIDERRVERTGHAERAITRALEAALADQHPDGHWCYELEADCTIPAEYITYMHFMGEIDPALEARLARYLIDRQNPDGSWPLYHGGHGDISCTVKAYYALKLTGHDTKKPVMQSARRWILQAGGAERSNVFTRFLLAMYGQIPWRGVPSMPIEILLLPRWFFFHMSKVSYWSRAVMVPLLVLYSLKAQAANPRDIHIPELFNRPPEQIRDWHPVRSRMNRFLVLLDSVLRRAEPLIPRFLRRRALRQAEHWLVERLNGEDGLGAIFPAMVNAAVALKLLGYPAEHAYRVQAHMALERLLIEKDRTAYCQPCVSPVWDTALMSLALHETGDVAARRAAVRGLDWLAERQLTQHPGDWQRTRPDLPGGGWAFQYNNPHYPDLDDTAAVAWAMLAIDPERYRGSIQLAAQWLAGMQSANGGFASFEVDNTYYYLNEIPFADHGALLDPPTADVSARCLTLFAALDQVEFNPARERVAEWLLSEQEEGGRWFGRWGTNYIYGTWSALVALGTDANTRHAQAITRAANWLKSGQREDGGWGESNDSYFEPRLAGQAQYSSSFQTAWAVLGLIAAGEADSVAVADGVDYLIRHQAEDGFWYEPWFTAPGFPRVFYLKYHGYSRYFPLWALAAYRRALKQ